MGNLFKLDIFLVCIILSGALQRQSLNGQWTLTGGDPEITIDANVPGGVYTDLMTSGQIDDIFFGNGDTDYRWVGLSNWTYTSTFTVDETLLQHRVINIVLEGLDTFATVLINGEEVGQTQNMFARYAFDIKDQLQEGSNDISVQFESSANRAEALGTDPANEYVIPRECPPEERNGICYVNRIRKLQASYAWDWGPAFASLGIWKNVTLEAFNVAVIDYLVATPSLNSDENLWGLTVTTYFNSGQLESYQGALLVHLDTGNAERNVQKHTTFSANADDFMNVTITTPVELVNSWWPNGYGTQDLYNLTVTFFTDEDDPDTKTIRVGFRTVELVQEELEQGLSFYFRVNGRAIFAKGANEIPINILPELGQDRDVVRNVLQTARDTHMNMLRVWGGGVYESDYFYDLADEYGILIWQDFMFACAMYPVDSDFLSNVAEEVRHQLKRLGGHPSIVIWSGNNENEAALSQNWYGTEANFDQYKNDYLTLYVDLIQPQVTEILPAAIYITSSPTNGVQSVQQDHVADDPYDPYYGDVHFYNYVDDSWAVETFPTPRFASEYGYQSMPCLESWLTATDDLADVDPASAFLENRQHHLNGNQQNLDLIDMQLQLPDSGSENYATAFIYFSQILQAQSVKIQTEHYRSFKGRVGEDLQGFTMGALYWQLNDVWVAPTWSGLDYTGRWKMLQYFALDFFNPMTITGRLTSDNVLELYAILDQLEVPDVDVKAVLRVYSWNSLDSLISVEFPVTLDTEAAVVVTTIDAAATLTTAGCGTEYDVAKANCFFHFHLMDQANNDLAPANYVFPEKLKNSNLADASVDISSVTSTDEENVFEIVVSTDAVALFVWLDSHEILGRFSENGFLLVQSTRTVSFTAGEAINVDDLVDVLTVTHLRDPVYV